MTSGAGRPGHRRGITGRAVLATLRPFGARATLTDDSPADAARTRRARGGPRRPRLAAVDHDHRVRRSSSPAPGLRPDAPLLAAAAAAGVPIWGDIEFTWRVDSGRSTVRRGVAGGDRTNGKTTTTSMLHVDPRGRRPSQHGSAAISAYRCSTCWQRPAEVLAVELSSFPAALGTVGAAGGRGGAQYRRGSPRLARRDARLRRAKGARCWRPVAVVGLDDPVAAALLDTAAARSAASGSASRRRVNWACADGVLVDHAFGDAAALAGAASIPARRSGRTARCAGRGGTGSGDRTCRRTRLPRAGLAPRRSAPRRGGREVDGVARSSTIRRPPIRTPRSPRSRPPAGGVDRRRSTQGCRGRRTRAGWPIGWAAAVLIGRDAVQIANALARHAPGCPRRAACDGGGCWSARDS